MDGSDVGLSKVFLLVLNYYPLLFLSGYLYSLNAFFEAARKYDEDFYSQLGKPHIIQNATRETLDLFLRCMWFKRYFGREKRVVAKAKAVRTAFFVLIFVVATYPFVRGYWGG